MSFNYIYDIAKLPYYLKEANFNNNIIRKICELPVFMTKLWIDNNSLQFFPSCPDNISHISLINNEISNLYAGNVPKSIKYLDVTKNDISYIHPELKFRVRSYGMIFKYDDKTQEYLANVENWDDDPYDNNVEYTSLYDDCDPPLNFYSNNNQQNYEYDNYTTTHFNYNYYNHLKHIAEDPLCVSVYNTVKITI